MKMAEMTIDAFKNTLDTLISSNAHARNKGDDFKDWCKEHFCCDARISHVKEQRQITNRVSEQFRYFAPIVVFVCVPEVKREKLIEYVLTRVYANLENVAIIGVTSDGSGNSTYCFEELIVFKKTSFTEWAQPLFLKTIPLDIQNYLGAYTDNSLPNSRVDYAWYVGATGNNDEGEWADFSEQYILEGRWENRYQTKYTEVVKTIKVGDNIVIKSSYTKKRGLPFENNNRTVGAMAIKAIGVVTENPMDGKNLRVNWTPIEPIKEWFGDGVLRTTVHCVKAQDGYIKQALLRFTFEDVAQDYSVLEEQYQDDEDIDTREESEPYDKSKFLADVFMTDMQYEQLKRLLFYKKNIILQGAPGVGKTYLAKKLAYSILGEKNDKYIEMVQFHQNYSYEDFIMGYKPNDDGFELKNGIFYNFCKKAECEPSKKFFFIIDEINRGNLSKIFGELMMLIESDKRGEDNKIKLAYRDELFSVPANLYIIGMMNTADRSLAMMDYALRRRFSFFDVEPAFDKPAFKAHILRFIGSTVADKVVTSFLDLNKNIADENSSGLGKGYCVGHSYFCVPPVEGQTDEDWYSAIIEYEISPLLYEYWWDDKDKAEDCIKELTK